MLRTVTLFLWGYFTTKETVSFALLSERGLKKIGGLLKLAAFSTTSGLLKSVKHRGKSWYVLKDSNK